MLPRGRTKSGEGTRVQFMCRTASNCNAAASPTPVLHTCGTYRTIAQRVGIDKIEARLLLDHTVPGIDGVYIHEKALFDKLLAAQERMTAAILALNLTVEGPR